MLVVQPVKVINVVMVFVLKIKDYTNGWYCPKEARGKSTIIGVTPNGSGHLSDGSKLTITQIIEKEKARRDKFEKEINDTIQILKDLKIEGFSNTVEKFSDKMTEEKRTKLIAELEKIKKSYKVRLDESKKDGLEIDEMCLEKMIIVKVDGVSAGNVEKYDWMEPSGAFEAYLLVNVKMDCFVMVVNVSTLMNQEKLEKLVINIKVVKIIIC